MDLEGRTLLIPEKSDIERDAVAAAWSACGGQVLRLGRFWDPPTSLDPSQVTLYGNDTFCLVLEQKLGLSLVSPPDDLIGRLDQRWLGRNIEIARLVEALSGTFPRFVKPVVPKQFTAAIYHDPEALQRECDGLESDVEVVLSSIVNFQAEARSFVLNGAVLDTSIYEGIAPLAGARAFTKEFCLEVPLPLTCVIDAGFIEGTGWAFVEANASWGAGLNGCDAERVLPAILAATNVA